ncbi:MAG: DUF58 domain-containing protein [Alcanivoracaceae bacterium]|jgi:uncharacterized protein (DUF58 family)|nr:DUF58 domain-containing protein [Alcanivoracaceae bacterium]
MIIPGKRLQQWVLLWLALGLAPVAARLMEADSQPLLLGAWLLAGSALLAYALADLWQLLRRRPPIAERRLPSALSVQLEHPVSIRLHSNSFAANSWLADEHPGDDPDTGLPVLVHPASDGNVTEFTYRYRPSRRGLCQFGDILLWQPSAARLFRRRYRISAATDLPVYPDFSVLQRDALKAHQDSRQLGSAHHQQRRGQGMEFHQLREYRPGDSLRQIDWKASARRRALISRDYEEEQNQQLIVLLDGGQRLAMKADDVSAFDHALNATLLLSWQAGKQGDRPGVMLFSGDQPLWIPPLGGTSSINQLLNHLYPLQPSPRASDYADAARRLLENWQRHSLVVLVTHLQPDDEEDLLAAIKLLSRRHLVLVADMLQPAQARVSDLQPRSMDDAWLVTGDAIWQEGQQALYTRLQHAGALVVSALPWHLPARLNQLYLTLKRAGRL